jgi:DNA sulfur modification protein DndB
MSRRARSLTPTLRAYSAGAFGYSFPAIRGVQAGREYFVSMCPLRIIPKIFLFNEEELVPELRAQRVLNKVRVPEIARYLLQNRTTYTFSALTASLDGDVKFIPANGGADGEMLGRLSVAMDARFVINDGQHRRAAIEAAIREAPDLADESIGVVFFLDAGLKRSQQMFADLNRHAIRPSTSLGVLYDQRDADGQLIKQWLIGNELFRNLTEMERSTLAERSVKLFTLSALYHASLAFLTPFRDVGPDERERLLSEFWIEIAKQFPEWRRVAAKEISSASVRRESISSHGITLQSLGRAGAALLVAQPKQWPARLKALRDIDWRRTNTKLWEGRALVGGKVSKASTNVTLTTNVIKKAFQLSLTPEEERIERAKNNGKR